MRLVYIMLASNMNTFYSHSLFSLRNDRKSILFYVSHNKTLLLAFNQSFKLNKVIFGFRESPAKRFSVKTNRLLTNCNLKLHIRVYFFIKASILLQFQFVFDEFCR